jgi:hypothetical protein
MPLSLSDDEYAAVMQAAAPIVPSDRGLFLESLAEALARHPIVGPGLVHRLAADLQRKFVVQARTETSTPFVGGKHRRPTSGEARAGAEAHRASPASEKPA